MQAFVATMMAMTLAAGMLFPGSAQAAAAAQATTPTSRPESVQPTGIRAAYRNGQTFVTWKDAAEGEAGSHIRYSLYRADEPIAQDNLAKADLCYHGVLNNSAKLIGQAYMMKDRLEPAKPTCTIEEGGQPLAMWTGVSVRTITRAGASYYAVVATDEQYRPLSKVVRGESATAAAVEEKVAPIQPIRQADKGRPALPGERQGLPLTVSLHGSTSAGPKAGGSGALYLYFATAEMGWRDGLPGVFTVSEPPSGTGAGAGQLVLAPVDAIENPSGNGVIETCWFGYLCVPLGSPNHEPRVYPFTERRLAWMIRWTMGKFQVDPLRVYSVGQSMGGMASTQFGLRRPELFAAVYPRLQRVRQSWLPAMLPATTSIGEGPDKGPHPGQPWTPMTTSINKGRYDKPTPMEDGKTDYFEYMDSVKWVREHHEDLPFYGWCCGRTDWVEPWKAYIEMVAALTANHHGFALAWTNGGHDNETPKCMVNVTKYYSSDKFALNQSYPAFGHSSINDDMGSGEMVDKVVDGKTSKVLKDGTLTGGVNLGFIWSEVADQADKWSAKLSNDLCKGEPMTVDVTPRRCQKFKPKPGEKIKWTSSAGGAGEVAADQWGLVTIEKVQIKPGEPTVLTIGR